MMISLILVLCFVGATLAQVYNIPTSTSNPSTASPVSPGILPGIDPEIDTDVKYPDRPHIIIFMADDLGFDDVSFRGSSQILTPNIDALGYQGVILNRHYVPYACTPSRAAFLTGVNPVHSGMQHYVLLHCDPTGLPLHLKLLPEYLKQAGYRTHLVGKWHLGFARKAYIPTERGFDSFFGFYTGAIDYWNHTTWLGNFNGYDFRRNEEVTYEGLGQYATHLFTNESLEIIKRHNPRIPLFLVNAFNAPHTASISGLSESDAPQEEKDKLTYIRDPILRTHAAMIRILDRSIGQIIRELSLKRMLSNSVILFYSDNGAPTRGIFETQGSNFPLRGQKLTTWEGAIRVPAAIWSPLIEVRHGVSNHLIYNTDWLPTFVGMTGVRPIGELDGYDIWPTLVKNKPSPRKRIIHNIDPIDGLTAFYYRGWKYINGSTDFGIYDSWLGSDARYRNPDAKRYAEIVVRSDTWQALAPFARRTLGSSSIRRIRRNTRTFCQPKIPYALGCNPLKGPCLFRIKEDPCELNNLAYVYPHKTYLMKILMKRFQARTVYPVNLPADLENCNPAKYNGTFTWWLDIEAIQAESFSNSTDPEIATEINESEEVEQLNPLNQTVIDSQIQSVWNPITPNSSNFSPLLPYFYIHPYPLSSLTNSSNLVAFPSLLGTPHTKTNTFQIPENLISSNGLHSQAKTHRQNRPLNFHSDSKSN
ncbi:arylsulfatase B-like [Phlebotomus argentipes]|uniref:arylsulfatase B-like n=1 Tax=Phlebotomus argentipes TaxID=94469 RepID=UPI0028929CA6|nr:arylsulfatase B-like [Phlebotomus argentipes]